ncbi:MAG TPA: hypothetical protein DCQ06_09280 [Myxococcales bacterium]|nr:hypothetical protein [Myxococcales bacterium]HAN31774.1 hypothetical protein [Myxococcales bacterium]
MFNFTRKDLSLLVALITVSVAMGCSADDTKSDNSGSTVDSGATSQDSSVSTDSNASDSAVAADSVTTPQDTGSVAVDSGSASDTGNEPADVVTVDAVDDAGSDATEADAGSDAASVADAQPNPDAQPTPDVPPMPDTTSSDTGVSADSATTPDAGPGPTPVCKPTQLVLKKVHDAKQRKALCNDGTDAVYYIRAGVGTGAKRWAIHLQGGGACPNACGCESRWATSNSKMTAATKTCKDANGLSTAMKSKNPGFYNWNHVFVHYCSSDAHGGDTEQARNPTELAKCPKYNKAGPSAWQFRGNRVVQSIFEDLVNSKLYPKNNLTEAEFVMFSGSSAGSSGMRRHMDWVGDFVKQKAAGLKGYRAVVDAAWIVDEPPGGTLCKAKLDCFKALHDWWGLNYDASCAAKHKSAPWTCMDTWFEKQELKSTYFVYMDQADQNSLKKYNIYPSKTGEFSADDKKKIGDFAKLVMDSVKINGKYKPGVYLSRRGHHTALYAPGDRFFEKMIGKLSVHDVLFNWVAAKSPDIAVDSSSGKDTNWSVIAKAFGKSTDETAGGEGEELNSCSCSK